jgi:hypothetical protein
MGIFLIQLRQVLGKVFRGSLDIFALTADTILWCFTSSLQVNCFKAF